MQYAYPCRLIPDREEGAGFVGTFPDVPAAITGARTRKESLVLAEDALVAALSVYVARRDDLPTPSPVADGQYLIAVPPLVAAKLALYTAMREQRPHRCRAGRPARAERLCRAETRGLGPPLPHQPRNESLAGRRTESGYGRPSRLRGRSAPVLALARRTGSPIRCRASVSAPGSSSRLGADVHGIHGHKGGRIHARRSHSRRKHR